MTHAYICKYVKASEFCRSVGANLAHALRRLCHKVCVFFLLGKKKGCGEWPECKCAGTSEHKSNSKKASYKYDNYLPPTSENGSSSDHSHDCGYSSENNNGCCETGSVASSVLSSPEGSEMACSDRCCQLDEDLPHNRLSYGFGQQLSLQEMLEVYFASVHYVLLPSRN